MKKYLLFSLAIVCAFGTLQAQSQIQVSTGESDVNSASLYYYTRLCRHLDKAIEKGLVHVYQDESLKTQIKQEDFLKATRMEYLVQIVDPATPDDPYNLIDTMLPKNIAIATAEYLLWKGNSIEFRSGTIDGKQTYYLSQKEVQKQVNSSEYALCALFSQHFGQVNSANLGAKSFAFLQIWLKPFFETRKLTTFSNQSLTSPLKKEDLNKTFTIENEIISITRYMYPLALDSCRALYFSYSSEAEEDEIELDHQSVALMYRSGNFGVSPWYWTSSKEIRTLYSPMEWQVIMAIQHYSIRNKIYPFFEHYE